MNKAAALALFGLGLGFVAGFLWGQGTRDALSGNTTSDFSGGVLTVRLNAAQAARQGLAGLLG